MFSNVYACMMHVLSIIKNIMSSRVQFNIYRALFETDDVEVKVIRPNNTDGFMQIFYKQFNT